MRRAILVILILFVLNIVDINASDWLSAEYDYDEFEEEIDVEIQCKEPPQINNGETIVWGDGLLLEYRCKEGFFPVGVTHGACDLFTGAWTIEPPICAETGCPEITPPNHGVVNLDSSGGLASVHCRPGYYLIGDSTLVCENGQWKGIFPICTVTAKPDDKSKTRLKNLISGVQTNPLNGITLEDSDESCFYNQVSPPIVKNAVVDTSYVMNELRQRYVMVATYTCMGGYRLKNPGASQLFCQNLVWSAEQFPVCIDENDPCEIENGGCSHYCVTTGPKRFACSCDEGFGLDQDFKTCIDTDECAIENGGCEQECFNTEGGFFCSCMSGYIPDGKNCTDIDECAKTSPTACPGPCINVPGGYSCDCNITGYTNSSSPEHCEDIDECLEDNGGCGDTCINRLGTYQCTCEEKGWRLGEDNHTCVDVDECTRYKGKVCKHGTCENTEGSFFCTCNDGFYVSSEGNTCLDLDECDVNNGGCEQLCINEIGSFRCDCLEGYVPGDNRSTCQDVNECKTDNGGCEDQCLNSVGSFTCGCTHIGVVLHEDGRSCKQCSPSQFFNRDTSSCNDCPPNAVARDGLALSVADCHCDVGFHGDPGRDVQCQDTNECQTGEIKCSHDCVNTIGSVYCACPDGYAVKEEDPTNCHDVDECSLGTHNCSHICANTVGSYTCHCKMGYRLLYGTMCEDVDECDKNMHHCSQMCVNIIGSYKCDCGVGFRMMKDGFTCQDINECDNETYPCDHKCINTEGSFECGCEGKGFKLSKDKKSCLDINECMEGNNPCPDACVNTVGSYVCDCDRPGYLLSVNGSGCEDIDECSAKPPPCEHECINTPGSYRCQCKAGYVHSPDGNETLCIACDSGTYRDESHKKCKRCPPGSTTNQVASTSVEDCKCLPGFNESGIVGLCLDIDECSLDTFECEQGCVNTKGSAHCVCRHGFVIAMDGRSCEDRDECDVQNGWCEHVCINTPGSYRCECKTSAFKLSENGRSCEEIDECSLPSLNCQYRCVNTPTGAKCTCPAGHHLMPDKRKCMDTNECLYRNGGCTDTCINTLGSYRCACNVVGYQLYTDGKQCIDVDECAAAEPACEDLCVNTQGSFVCYCRQPGYKLGKDGRSCEDINECQDKKLCEHKCINMPGSFRCDCELGYYKNGRHCIPCEKGSYRGKKDSVISCKVCPPGMSTNGTATTSVLDCFCDPGYQGNPETRDKCEDINECARNNGGCAHNCINTEGSFYCACYTGHILHKNGVDCVPTHCPLLPLPKYGKFDSKECMKMKRGVHVPVGTNCTYTCRARLVVDGHKTRTCQEDYTWNGEDPACIALPCERLPVPDNGYLHPPECMLPRIKFKTRCVFRCNKGYRRVGRVGTKCRANTRWSGNAAEKPAKCVKKGKNTKSESKSKSKSKS